jgi:hypothetical protein
MDYLITHTWLTHPDIYSLYHKPPNIPRLGWLTPLLGIVYTSIYKTSKCGKQLPDKAICKGQIANPSVLRMDIAESVKYTYGEETHGFRDNTACWSRVSQVTYPNFLSPNCTTNIWVSPFTLSMTPTSKMTWPNWGDTPIWLQTTETQSYWVIHCSFPWGKTPEVIQMSYRETSETPEKSSAHPIVIVYWLRVTPRALHSLLAQYINL